MKSPFRKPAFLRAAISIAVCSLAGSFLFVRALAAESPSVLLQKAIFAEETEGNLDAAIKIYEGIVKETDANRSVAAQAQYRLGMCELKRGKREEAAVAFRKLIDRYSDAAELVSKSRERLTELGPPAAAVTVRQVWSGQDASGDSISSDGRSLAFIDWNSGNLVVRDLTTGQNRPLTSEASWENPVQFAESCAFSRDGKQIAYSWHGMNNADGLRVISLHGSAPRVLREAQTNVWLSAEDWSPDGKIVAVFDYVVAGTNRQGGIALVNAQDGSIRKLAILAGRANTLRFSPDGQFLAYNLPRNAFPDPASSRKSSDIFILDIQTGSPKLVVESSANERFMGWAPRGSEILFTSERRGPVDLWSIHVNGSEAKRFPRLLKTGVGEVFPVGLTRDGAFYYSSAVTDSKGVYMMSVDFEAGTVFSVPRLVQTLSHPRGLASDKSVCSFDMKYLFFCSGTEEAAAYVLDLETGKRREIENSRTWARRIGWWWPSSDSTALYVILGGRGTAKNESGLYKVNVQTGVIGPLALHGPDVQQMPTGPIPFRAFPDFLAYGRLHSNPKKFVLVKHDLSLSRETEYEIPDLVSDPIRQNPPTRAPGQNASPFRYKGTLLPDGRSFLFNSEDLKRVIWHDLETGTQKELLKSTSPIGIWDGAFGYSNAVFLVTSDDRDRSVFTLYSFESSGVRRSHQVTIADGFEHRGVNWVGPHFLLTKRVEQEKTATDELWTLSVRNGELKNIGVAIPNGGFPSGHHAFGTRLLFQSTAPRSTEIWVMENFLPPVARKN